MKTVDDILDGWFGEPLEYSENEERLRKYLYEPLRELHGVTINRLKNTIDRLELLHSQKDERIKELENQIEEYAIYLRSLPSERIDW